MSDPNKITYFGLTDFRNERKRFGIKNKDRARHVYVIGKTGMGKSTLLENMAAQDIEGGEGMCFIDPHGSAIETLLEYIPEHRVKDVVYFAPFDSDYPISFNVMEDVDPDKRHLVASGLMSTFKKIWVDAWSARMEYILNNTILALLEYPESTLLSVNRMLSDKGFRQEVVKNISDPSVKSFWVDEFGSWDDRYAREASAAIQNKIGQFTANPLIRNIIGQPKSSFDVRDMMDNQKIFLVNLSKGQIGEQNAGLLGGMIITAIYLGAMSRADVPKTQLAQLPDFYLFVDEFQNFANESFADILAEARKYKLSLTVAHQYIAQMEEAVSDAVFGNVGTTIAYRVGPMDAEMLEKVFSPTFIQEDIVNLGRFQFYLSLMIDEVGSKPFSATGIAPLPKPPVSFQTAVIESSRSKFAQPRGSVQTAIDEWHGQDFKTSRELKQQEKFEKKKSEGRFDKKETSTQNSFSATLLPPQTPPAPPSKIIIPEDIKIAALRDSSPQEPEKQQDSVENAQPVVQKNNQEENRVQSENQSSQDIKHTPFHTKKLVPRTKPSPQIHGNVKQFLTSVDKATAPQPKKPDFKISQKEASPQNKNTLKDALMKALGTSTVKDVHTPPQHIKSQNISPNSRASVEKAPVSSPAPQKQKEDSHAKELVSLAEAILSRYEKEDSLKHTSPQPQYTDIIDLPQSDGNQKEIPEDVLRSILE